MPELLNVAQAAEFLGVSKQVLYRDLKSGRFPVAPIGIGHSIKFSRRQLEQWLENPRAGDAEVRKFRRRAGRA